MKIREVLVAAIDNLVDFAIAEEFQMINELPDEILVEILDNHKFKNALDLGCGEGRNAAYMAKRVETVSAVDMSAKAVEAAKKFAAENDANIDFKCENMFDIQFDKKFDFIYDSGTFHHLAPHRRLSYLELLNRYLNDGGYFGLCCFAEGENCADEVDDYEFYKKRRRVWLSAEKDSANFSGICLM